MKPEGDDKGRMVPWDLTASDTLGRFRVYDVLRETRRNPRDGREHVFCVQASRDWATVVPVTADGRVVLVRQFRPGTGEVTWEFPGGVVESGEEPLSAVRRELEEESGFTAGELVHVASFRPNPALIRNSMHVYLARGCQPSGSRHFDDAEDLDTWSATVEEVDRMIEDGSMDHALMVASWLFTRRRLLA